MSDFPFEKRNYRIAEFSKAYGICRSLVYREIKLGNLKVFKVGKCTLISRDAAFAWQQLHEKSGIIP